MSAEITKKVINIVSDFESDFDEAERNFDIEASSIERRASGSFGYGDASLAIQIANDSKRITDDLFSSYESIVISLDSEVRGYLGNGLEADGIHEVWQFISHVNEEAAGLSCNVTASSGSSRGSLKSITYNLTTKMKTIEKKWEMAYKDTPEAKEEEKRRAEAIRKRMAQREKELEKAKAKKEKERIEKKKKELEKKEETYNEIVSLMDSPLSIEECNDLIKRLQELKKFKNSDVKIKELKDIIARRNSEINDSKYEDALELFESASNENDYREARAILLGLPSSYDTKDTIRNCDLKINAFEEKKEQLKEKLKYLYIALVCLVLFACVSFGFAIKSNINYNSLKQTKERALVVELNNPETLNFENYSFDYSTDKNNRDALADNLTKRHNDNDFDGVAYILCKLAKQSKYDSSTELYIQYEDFLVSEDFIEWFNNYAINNGVEILPERYKDEEYKIYLCNGYYVTVLNDKEKTNLNVSPPDQSEITTLMTFYNNPDYGNLEEGRIVSVIR